MSEKKKNDPSPGGGGEVRPELEGLLADLRLDGQGGDPLYPSPRRRGRGDAARAASAVEPPRSKPRALRPWWLALGALCIVTPLLLVGLNELRGPVVVVPAPVDAAAGARGAPGDGGRGEDGEAPRAGRPPAVAPLSAAPPASVSAPGAGASVSPATPAPPVATKVAREGASPTPAAAASAPEGSPAPKPDPETDIW
jgi:hypothetical protein